MRPKPEAEEPGYPGSGRLRGKCALITGGDSGIGKAAAIAFAKEGAKVSIVYLNEHQDAEETAARISDHGGEALLIAGDICDPKFCHDAVEQTVERFGALNILVNNAAVQYPAETLEEILPENLEKTFRTNIFAMFYLTSAALKHLRKGDCIINTTSVTAYRGSPHLIDYASTKGAIVSFTRSLSQNLLEKRGIRVNAVAPGPVWTPLIPSSFDEEKVGTFGDSAPMGRAAQPEEIAPSYVFLASDDASFMSGQVLHPNGGELIGS